MSDPFPRFVTDLILLALMLISTHPIRLHISREMHDNVIDIAADTVRDHVVL